MLDFVYYPISAVLWFWRRAFGPLFGADSGPAWALAIVFLVATVRVVLLRPAIGQARTQQRLQLLQPRLTALRHKHADDPQRLVTETLALQREHGVNPFLGLMPALLQIPIFLGLTHVLRSFHATTASNHAASNHAASNQAASNQAIPNYVFNTTDVRSFLDARIFDAPLSATLTAHPGASTIAVALTLIPLILLSMVATHLTARLSIARATTPATAQTALMNRLLLWFLPAGALVTAPIWPLGIVVYFAAQSVFTLVQQYFLPQLAKAQSAMPVKT